MDTLFELPETNAEHPAKYTDALLSAFVKMLEGKQRVLDPFGGTGKIFLLNHWYPEIEIQAVEIEPEWAAINPRTILGNALHLQWDDEYFDAICTSPAYGNKFADKYCEGRTHIGYPYSLKRNLHPDNAGAMQWGDKYRQFHVVAWLEAKRVLCVGGVFVLNIKNHIRAGEEQLVTEWHIDTLQSLGFELVEHVKINTPSMRYGTNREKRIEYENVIEFERIA